MANETKGGGPERAESATATAAAAGVGGKCKQCPKGQYLIGPAVAQVGLPVTANKWPAKIEVERDMGPGEVLFVWVGTRILTLPGTDLSVRADIVQLTPTSRTARFIIDTANAGYVYAQTKGQTKICVGWRLV
jgi:hypothetical protein